MAAATIVADILGRYTRKVNSAAWRVYFAAVAAIPARANAAASGQLSSAGTMASAVHLCARIGSTYPLDAELATSAVGACAAVDG